MSDPFSEVLLVFTEFGVPSTQALDFNACIGGNISFEARELLTVATQRRETLQDGLDNSGHQVDARSVVGAVEHYVPLLYKILHSMEKSGSAKLVIKKPMTFKWTSVLVKKALRGKEFKGEVLVFELCFVLTIQALAHYNAAKLLLAPERQDRLDNLVAAVKELRKGAGILEFVSQYLLPKWETVPDSRPPEVCIPVVSALASIFLAMAQRVSVAQAVLKNTPPSTIAKLLFGLSERYSNINRELLKLDDASSVGTKGMYASIFEAIVDEPPMMAVACFSMGLKFLGEAAKDKTKIGESVALLFFASENMLRITYTAAMNELYKGRIQYAQQVIDAQAAEYRKDNEAIYFEGVPTRDRLEIPKGAFIIKPDDYSLPDAEAVSFASTEAEQGAAAGSKDAASPPKSPGDRKSGGLGAWFGMGGKKKQPASAADASGPLKAPPGYDESVFNELPEDIQQEVVASYRAQNK